MSTKVETVHKLAHETLHHLSDWDDSPEKWLYRRKMIFAAERAAAGVMGDEQATQALRDIEAAVIFCDRQAPV